MNLNYGKDRKRGVDFLAPQFPGNSGLNISPANAAGRSGGTGGLPETFIQQFANRFFYCCRAVRKSALLTGPAMVLWRFYIHGNGGSHDGFSQA